MGNANTAEAEPGKKIPQTPSPVHTTSKPAKQVIPKSVASPKHSTQSPKPSTSTAESSHTEDSSESSESDSDEDNNDNEVETGKVTPRSVKLNPYGRLVHLPQDKGAKEARKSHKRSKGGNYDKRRRDMVHQKIHEIGGTILGPGKKPIKIVAGTPIPPGGHPKSKRASANSSTRSTKRLQPPKSIQSTTPLVNQEETIPDNPKEEKDVP